MSTFIPILSSSPPPMDDDPFAKDDWEDEDFGGFQTANTNLGIEGSSPDQTVSDNITELDSQTEKKQVLTSTEKKQVLTSTEPVPVPDTFQKLQSDDLKRTPSQDGQSDHGDSHDDNDLDNGLNLKPSTVPKTDAQDNTSQESVVTDSGLCSDVSPGPKCEDESDMNALSSQPKEIDTALTTSQDSGNDGPEDVYGSDASASYLPGANDGDIEPLDLKAPAYDETGDDFDDDSFEQFNSAREVSTNLQLDSPDTECSEESKTESATQEMLDVSPIGDANLHQDTVSVEENDSKTETLSTLQTELSEGEDVNDCQSGAEDDILSPASGSHVEAPESDRHLPNSEVLTESPSLDVAAEKCDNLGTQEASLKVTDVEVNNTGDFPASDGDFGEFLASNADDQKTSGNKNETELKCNSSDIASADSGNIKDNEEVDDDDDDDEWAFHDAKPVITPAAADDADDWAFQNADQGAFGGGGFAQFDDGGDDSGESNWASFADAAATPTDIPSVDEDEFGDFEDVKTEDPVSASVSSFLSGDIPVMDTVLKQCFHQQDINGNPVDEVDQLLAYLNQENVRTEQKQEIVPGQRHPVMTSVTVDMNLWNHLKDIENTKALQYNWRDSSNKTCLLKSLGIDARNILMNTKRQGGTTIFNTVAAVATTPASSSNNILEPLQPVPVQSSVSTLLNSNKNFSNDDQNTQSTDPQHLANTPQQDIPAVEFDWSSSGLTNPLDSANLRLDLDFFVTHPSSSSNITSPTAALENELLQSIEPSRNDQPKSLQPLETLLANMKYSSTAPMSNKKEQILSPEALRIIQTFPDISFMKAKFLVFPLRSMAENEQEDN